MPTRSGQLERAHAEAAAEPDDAVDRRHVGDALVQQRQRLEAERPVAAVDEEAGAVGGVDDALAHRLAEPARDGQRLGRGLQAGDDLDERHDRRRVEEVQPDDARRVGRRAASAVIGIDEVFEARTARGAAAETAARTSRLSARRSGAASRTTSAAARSSSAGAACSRPRARVGLLGRQAPALDPAPQRAHARARSRSRAPAGRGRAAASRRRVRAGELRDARAHGAGADDADDHQEGTSALMPVSDAADDQLLDLRGALVERRHAHVAEEALDREVVDVARAAVDLDRVVGAPDRRLGREVLGDRRLGRVRRPASFSAPAR